MNNSFATALFVNYLPTPLVLLTDAKGVQTVHIAPEAFTVASAEFPDQIDFWQNALPGPLKGKLESVSRHSQSDTNRTDLEFQLSGATILKINGQDPWVAVNANALIAGSFQGLGTRQNGYARAYDCL